MEKKNGNHDLVAAILIAALVIGGSNVFVGWKVQGGGGLSASASVAKIDDAALLKKIDDGINTYIDRQKQDQIAQQEQEQKLAEEAAKNVKKPQENDHYRGQKDALITLIEYSDYECPFCKVFHQTATELVKDYDGKLNWVYRHFPLGFHEPMASKLAVASECVAEQKGDAGFWTFSDAAFANQEEVTDELISKWVASAGANIAKFNTCVKSGKFADRVQQDLTEGGTYGISGTPGNILYHNRTGQVRLLPGALPAEEFKRVIDEMLRY